MWMARSALRIKGWGGRGKSKSQALMIEPEPSTLQRVSRCCGQKVKMCTTTSSSRVDKLLPRCSFLVYHQNDSFLQFLIINKVLPEASSMVRHLILNLKKDPQMMCSLYYRSIIVLAIGVSWFGISSRKKRLENGVSPCHVKVIQIRDHQLVLWSECHISEIRNTGKQWYMPYVNR